MKQIQLYVTLHCIPVLFQYEGTSLLQVRREPRKGIAKNEQVSGESFFIYSQQNLFL